LYAARDHHDSAKGSIYAEEQPWQDGKTERPRHHRRQERSKRLLEAHPQGRSAYAVEGHGGKHQEHKDHLRGRNGLVAQESGSKRPDIPLTPVSFGPLETGITVDALSVLVPTIETAGLAHLGLYDAHFGWSKASE
jgi:hypothetical protein